MTMLEELHRTRRTRVIGAVAVAASLVAVSVVGTALLVGTPSASHDATPGQSVTPTAPAGEGPCADAVVTCLEDGRYRVALDIPVTVALPPDFRGDFATFGPSTVEDYRSDVDNTGVTVFENATPAKNRSTWTADPAAGTTARSMATWLVHRPFLSDASMEHVTVGGLHGWRVVAQLRDGARLRAVKGGLDVAPAFVGHTGNAGYGTDLKGDYTLVDVPGAGVTVIWSWTLQPDRQVLDGNQRFVDGLSFG